MKAIKRGKKWYVKIYDYTDTNGKQHFKDFSASTKAEAEYLAKEYALFKNEQNKTGGDMLFKVAVRKYIDERSNILSPSTVRTHRSKLKNFKIIDDIPLRRLKSDIVQRMVNEWALTLSPKSIKNLYGMITVVIGSYYPSLKLVVHLPKITPKTYSLPSESDLKAIINEFKDTEMILPIYLSAFGMMREGEISAFEKSDLEGNVLHVSKNMVMNDNHEWVIKSTKTTSSDRYVQLPDFVCEEIRKMPNETLGLTPKAIYGRFSRCLKRNNINHFRFHDLRHYCASFYHFAGVPDTYIMQQGGWRSDLVLKQVYRHSLDEHRKEVNNLAISKLESMFGNEDSSENFV